MRLTVIVPTYRRPRELRRCLDALAEQERRADEVVVVHRRDDVDAAGVIREAALDTIRPVLVESPGVLAALRAGVAHATGEAVAFTDDDAAPRPDWLARIEAGLEGAPDLGGIGGRDLCWYGTRLVEEGRTRRVGRVQWFGRLTSGHHAGAGAPQDVHVLKGCNMAFRREVLRAVGFDERMRGTGAQPHFELSLCLQALRCGWKLRYDPRIAVDHYPARRHDDDQREAPTSTAVEEGAHNETLAVLEHLGPIRRAVFWLWAAAIGTRPVPGLLQAVRRRVEGDRSAWRTLVAVQRGRLTARRTSRASRVEGGLRVGVIAHSPAGCERGELLFAGRAHPVVPGGRSRAGAWRAVSHACTPGRDVLYLVDVGLSTTLAAVVARALGRRVVVDTGDLSYALARSVGRRGIPGLASVWIGERVTLGLAHHVVVRGHGHLEHVRREHVTVIRDLPPRCARPVDGTELSRRLGLEREFVVGLVGSLNVAPRLGIGYGWDLVEALALIDARIVALVVGDGPGRAALEARAGQLGVVDRLRILGALSPDATVEAIAAMDAAISTQTNDAVGRVRTTGKLPLYLACGCPVIASHVGEAARLLGPLGWTLPYEGTVDRGYPARLAARIRQWAGDRDAQPDRRRAALALARAAFDVEAARRAALAAAAGEDPLATIAG